MAKRGKTTERRSAEQRLKKTGDFKWIRYTRYLCIMMIVIFLIYVSALVTTTQGGFQELFETNLFVVVGFCVCFANLYISYELKAVHDDLLALRHVEAAQLKLILTAAAELVLFNYAAAALVIFSLFSYFRWKGTGLGVLIRKAKEQGQGKKLLLYLAALAALTALTYLIAVTALTI